jgi:hypothetical protein
VFAEGGKGREGKGWKKEKGKGKVVSPNGTEMGFIVPRGRVFVLLTLQRMRTRRIYHTQIVLFFLDFMRGYQLANEHK